MKFEAGFWKKTINLFAISFLSLYFELLIIRWLSSQIRIFAYFKNIPLLASVFGLGLGLALVASKRDFSRWFPLCLLIVSVLISFAEPLHLVHIAFTNSAEFYLIGTNTVGFMDVSYLQKVGTVLIGLSVLVAVFYLIVLMFVGLGQRLGQAFEGFKPLLAYTINVAGSLVAILTFTGFSFMSTKPEFWLTVGCVLCVYLYRHPLQYALLALAVIMPFCASSPNVQWSPYYRISIQPTWVQGTDAQHPNFFYGDSINVNYDSIEGAYDNRPATIAKLAPQQKRELLDFYDMLYQIIGDQPKAMLILAAGAGNDLAAALRHGANDIDAVEIDPQIVKLGRELHPEKPYDNPAVHPFVDDARAFMRRGQRKYDVVDYAYLDSHTAFSSMSSIRLDNYIYTVESFQDALKLLKPGGVLAVTFYPTTAWQTVRVFKTMTAALGYEPLGVTSKNEKGLTFLAGQDQAVWKKRAQEAGLEIFDKHKQEKRMNAEMATWDGVCVTTDDWPFLFLRQRGLALSYGGGLFFTLLIGWRLVGRVFGTYSKHPLGLNMFFLGAAFMLVEVKSISQMGLIVGTTWLVNAAVIGAILLMILLANLGQMYLKASRLDLLYGGLFASLVGSYFIPLSVLNTLPFETRVLLGAVVLALPMFFASWIFAITFFRVKEPQKALGMNLLGTLVGGALEYLSMIFGIAALNLIALVLYALAFWCYKKYVSSEPAEQLEAVQ